MGKRPIFTTLKLFLEMFLYFFPCYFIAALSEVALSVYLKMYVFNQFPYIRTCEYFGEQFFNLPQKV